MGTAKENLIKLINLISEAVYRMDKLTTIVNDPRFDELYRIHLLVTQFMANVFSIIRDYNLFGILKLFKRFVHCLKPVTIVKINDVTRISLGDKESIIPTRLDVIHVNKEELEVSDATYKSVKIYVTDDDDNVVFYLLKLDGHVGSSDKSFRAYVAIGEIYYPRSSNLFDTLIDKLRSSDPYIISKIDEFDYASILEATINLVLNIETFLDDVLMNVFGLGKNRDRDIVELLDKVTSKII